MTATAFTKLYSGILESTLWCEPDRTRLVWICMLAMADQYGRVTGSVPGLANRARVPIEDARTAITSFLAPDPDSRTKDFEGRRIEEIDGGWRLLNHAKYRAIRADDDRREQNRLAQARAREKKKTAGSRVSKSQQKSAESAHTNTNADADTTLTGKEISSLRDSSSARLPTCPHAEIVRLFHEALPSLPAIKLLDAKGRKTKLTEFWKWVLTSTKTDGKRRATTALEAYTWIREYFERAAQNDFIMGRTQRSPEHAGWRCSLDYLLSERGRIQVIEKTRDEE